MSFRGKRRNSGSANHGSTHNMQAANGGGRPYKMDKGASMDGFSRDASRTHKLNTPGGVSEISAAPMRGGIRL